MNKKGFTLLEVILFLAISSSLALVAFVGLGPRLLNVRFTDSVRGIEASIKSNLASSSKGQNIRAGSITCVKAGKSISVDAVPSGTSAGSGGDCIINGVAVLMDGGSQNKILYRQIVSLREKSNDPSCINAPDDFRKIIACYKSQVVDKPGTATTYNLTNGMKQITQGSKTKFGFMRIVDPESNAEYFAEISPNGYGFFSGSINALNPIYDKTHSFDVCYQLGNRKARLIFSNFKTSPDVRFEEECT